MNHLIYRQHVLHGGARGWGVELGAFTMYNKSFAAGNQRPLELGELDYRILHAFNLLSARAGFWENII